MQDRKLRLGGLWKNQTKSGESYYAGGLGPGLRLLIFQNNYKQNDKDPDLILYLAPADDNRKEQQRAANPEADSGLEKYEFPG